MTPILTIEQILDIVMLSRELSQRLFGVILDAAGQNIIQFGAEIWSAFMSGDWHSMGISVFIFVGVVVFTYRLVRRNLSRSIRHFFDT